MVVGEGGGRGGGVEDRIGHTLLKKTQECSGLSIYSWKFSLDKTKPHPGNSTKQVLATHPSPLPPMEITGSKLATARPMPIVHGISTCVFLHHPWIFSILFFLDQHFFQSCLNPVNLYLRLCQVFFLFIFYLSFFIFHFSGGCLDGFNNCCFYCNMQCRLF